MDDKQMKLIRWILIGAVVFLLLFVPIFNGCYFGLLPEESNDIFKVLFCVLFPLTLSGILLLASEKFKVFTKDDGIRQVETQYRNGVINQKQYQDSIKGLEMFELEKTEMKSKIEMEKIKFMNALAEEKRKLEEKTKGALENGKEKDKEKE